MGGYGKIMRKAQSGKPKSGNATCYAPCAMRFRAGRLIFQAMLLLILCAFFVPEMLAAEKKETMAILPFKINARKHLDHLQLGLQKMLSSRLEQRGFHIISPEGINKYPIAFARAMEESKLLSLGKTLKADWIVVGSLTQIGNKASIDLKVIDVSKKRPPFFIF